MVRVQLVDDDTEVLLEVPSVQLFQVQSGRQDLIQTGTFAIYLSGTAHDPTVNARVEAASWPLGLHVASLRFNDTTYTFTIPGAPHIYFCIVLAPDTPADVLELVQEVLQNVTAYHAAPPIPSGPSARAAAAAGEPPVVVGSEAVGTEMVAAEAEPRQVSTADKVAAGLMWSGTMLGRGIVTAAHLAGVGLQKGADIVVANTRSLDQPTRVSPETKARLDKALSVANQAAIVSGHVVSRALSASTYVAGAVAARVADSSLGRQFSRSNVVGASVQDLRTVGLAGVDALDSVYAALADAARLVMQHSSAASTHIIRYRYGAEAGQAARTGMQTAQSALEAGINVYKVRPTNLIKKTAKAAAKHAILKSTSTTAQAAASGPGPATPVITWNGAPSAQVAAPTHALVAAPVGPSSGPAGPSGRPPAWAGAQATTAPPTYVQQQHYQQQQQQPNGGWGAVQANMAGPSAHQPYGQQQVVQGVAVSTVAGVPARQPAVYYPPIPM